MNWQIYKHTLLVGEHAGWSYIGQTCKDDANDRWHNGRAYTGSVFLRAINKYGWTNFSHEIIESGITTIEKANEREKYWISFYHTYIKDPNCAGYNMTPGGEQWGNLASNWYTNGVVEILVLCTDEAPDGFYPGRLPLSETAKQQLSEISKLNGSGVRLGKQNLNRVHIHNGDINKSVQVSDLNEYLANGWSIGESFNKTAKKFKKIHCIETNEIFMSLKDATSKYGSHVADVLRGSRHHTHYLHFEYL